MEHPEKSAVTLCDIARRARISHVAVSRVLNGHHNGKVSEKRAEQIRLLARQMGYVPNSAARSLKLGKTHTIVLATYSSLKFPHINEIVEGVHAALLPHGYHLNIELLHFVKDPGQIYQTFSRARCDGLIRLDLSPGEGETLQRIHQSGLPVVVLFSNTADLPSPEVDVVSFDRREAARLAVDHLKQQGHRRIAFVLGTGEMEPPSVRLRACRLALRDAGLPMEDAHFSPWEVEADASGLWEKLRALRPSPTAIVAYNEEVAIGLVHHIRESGLRVPEDMAVIADSNPRQVRFSEVPLTAIDHDLPAAARAAVECLLARIKNPETPPQQILIQPSLKVRVSSVQETPAGT